MVAKKSRDPVEARKALARGVEKLAQAVRATLGPRGMSVVLERRWGSPGVTRDGMAVAEAMQLEEPFENLGAQLVRDVASRTRDATTDGTTTAVVLAQAIFVNGMRHLLAGLDPNRVKAGIDRAVQAVVEELRRQSRPVSGSRQLVQVAALVARDGAIGEAIVEAIEKAGPDGRIELTEVTECGVTARQGDDGAVLLAVGAASEAEQSDLRQRVESALAATRAAMDEGISAGGGAALIHAAHCLGEMNVSGDEWVGVSVVRDALEAPAGQIFRNAGLEGGVLVEKIRGLGDGLGFDVATSEYRDMIQAGILDPTKVVRIALQHAASIASVLLTADALVRHGRIT